MRKNEALIKKHAVYSASVVNGGSMSKKLSKIESNATPRHSGEFTNVNMLICCWTYFSRRDGLLSLNLLLSSI
jgi:hypothetical protein